MLYYTWQDGDRNEPGDAINRKRTFWNQRMHEHRVARSLGREWGIGIRSRGH